MLQLLAFQSYNWGYTPFMEPLPIGLLTLCYGNNGSGKTTYLTGIGLLLGVARLPTGHTYDRYVREGENWAFLKAVVANHPGLGGKRPFDQIIPDPQGHDACTLSCMLVNKAGEWKRSYYIVPGEEFQPDPGLRVDLSYSFTAEKYRASLQHVGVRPASLRLLELGITGLREVREPKRLFDFFVDLIGRETTRATYAQARREWRQAQEQLENTLTRYYRQQEEVEVIGKAIQTQRQRRKIEQDRARYQRFIGHARFRVQKEALAERSRNAQRLGQEQGQVKLDLQALAQQQLGLLAERAEFVRQYQAWQQQRDQTEARARTQSNALAVVQERMRVLLNEITNLRRPPLLSLTAIEQTLEAQRRREAALWQEIRDGERERDGLLQAVEALEQGRLVLPEEVNDFLKALRGQAIPFQLVADYVQVRDPRWLRAVEGILGGERFTIVVHDPTLRLRAKRLAEQRHYPYWVSPPKKRASLTPPPVGSLGEVVDVADEHVAGWVVERLWHIRRVETVEEGDLISSAQGVVTVTPLAYRQERRGGRSVYPKWIVCGHAARVARLQEIQRELEGLRTSLDEASSSLKEVQRQLRSLQQQEQRAREQQELPAKEQEYAVRQTDLVDAQTEANALDAEYEQIKRQEEEWTKRSNQLVRLEQEIEGEKDRSQARLQEITEQISNLRIESLKREVEQIEATLPALSPDMQMAFEKEQWHPDEYQKRIEEAEQLLERLPETEEPYEENLYEQQLAKMRELDRELGQARSRVLEHRDVFERAMKDYSEHIDLIFSRGMAHEFRQLCPLANARGDITVIKSDEDVNDWGLEVRIGFDGKPRESLSSAPLSRGQEVLTSLYLVLAALRTVHATPILVLDELMSLLDEQNAPNVLAGLKETKVQCFIATPQSRFGADEQADVLWGFSCKASHESLAPAIAVLVSRRV